MKNTPDDWGCFYRDCTRCGARYHASEGDCECPPLCEACGEPSEDLDAMGTCAKCAGDGE